ncbi:Alanine racemase 1 [compost metagenome]
MEMYRRTYAEIDLDHLAHNINVIQKMIPGAPFMCPMVKANAYGHGDVQLALFLETLGVKHLGVCLIEEGLLLRNLGVKAEILVFRGFDLEGAEKIIQYNMTPVVSTWEHLDHLEAVATSPVSIHLKFDTGMNRLGFHIDEAQKLYDRLWQNKKVRLKALVTHLFRGEDAVDPQGDSARQLRQLHEVGKMFKPFNVFLHALNSAGILSLIQLTKAGQAAKDHPLLLESWGLRPGLMIYGYNPLVERSQCELKPVMTLKSHVSAFRRLKAGETVSYGGTWKASKDSVIAVVPIGYADGYHRILSNQAFVLFKGQKVPVVGNICMDYLMLDVTAVVQNQSFDQFKESEVILFGQSEEGAFLSPEELAGKAQTITWEMLTSVGERVPRRYKGAQSDFITGEVGDQR